MQEPEQFERGGVIGGGGVMGGEKKLRSHISITVNINATVCRVHIFCRALLGFLEAIRMSLAP